tara:strand:+ start:85 stop:339 length:255 start_codon:yes stop_codon:yes gene_type:complete
VKVEWEQLADHVWALRGISPDGIIGESPTEFSVVLIDEGHGFAKLILGERIDCLQKSRALAKSLRAHGFSKARALRRGKERWYR